MPHTADHVILPGDQGQGGVGPDVPPGFDDGLEDGLIGQGFDRTKADQLAAELRANANKEFVPSTGAPPQIGGSPSASVRDIAPPSSVSNVDLESVLGAGSGLAIGNTDPTTRVVQDEELVSTQLEGLISGDSRFIRNARLRGLELANARGQFSSSFAAGAAELSALESALPIAQADAQAYRDTASQNMNALNTFALANIQRATTLDTAILSANTSINLANLDAQIRVSMANLAAQTSVSIANLDADVRTNIANLQSATSIRLQDMQNEMQFTLQSRELTHFTGMEEFKQEGRIELSLLDADLRLQLAQFEIDGAIQLSNLDHEESLIVNDIINGYELDRQQKDQAFQRSTQHANLAMQAQTNYVNYISSFADTDMDAAAAARLKADAWNHLVAELGMVNGLYPEFPPIVPTQG